MKKRISFFFQDNNDGDGDVSNVQINRCKYDQMQSTMGKKIVRQKID